MPGEEERTVNAVWVVDLAIAVYGPNHTRSEFVQVDAATRRLARTGKAERLLIRYKGDHGFRTRAYIAITEVGQQTD